jgi:Ca2+/H+ antiporter
MMTMLWILAAVASAIAMMAASRFAVGHAVAVAEKLRLPPFLVGVTLVALGTDMPEIVNSITASFLGHGDIAVGDAVAQGSRAGPSRLTRIGEITHIIRPHRRNGGTGNSSGTEVS